MTQTEMVESFNVSVTNTTAQEKQMPANYTEISSFFLNVTPASSVSLNITMGYPCKYNSNGVAPFEMENGTWKQLSYIEVPGSCKMQVSADNLHVIGLFYLSSAPLTTIAQAAAVAGLSSVYVAVVIVVIIVAAALAYLYIKRRPRLGR